MYETAPPLLVLQLRFTAMLRELPKRTQRVITVPLLSWACYSLACSLLTRELLCYATARTAVPSHLHKRTQVVAGACSPRAYSSTDTMPKNRYSPKDSNLWSHRPGAGCARCFLDYHSLADISVLRVACGLLTIMWTAAEKAAVGVQRGTWGQECKFSIS